jgi:hypothetical protein
MKQNLILLFLIFSYCVSFSNETKIDTLVNKKREIFFNKVTPSFEEANKAKLIIQHIDSSKLFNIRFVVPNYCYRYKTTLNDYFIIKTKKGSYRFDNQKILLPENNDQIFYVRDVMVIGKYIFEANVKSDLLMEILSDSILKVEFNFMPNANIEEGVKKIRNNDTLDRLEKHMISLSKRTIKVTIKEPEKDKLNLIKSFIETAF